VLASPASLYNQATAFSAGTMAIQTSRRGAGDLTGFQSLLEITDSRLILSALKQSENGCGYILRMVNMSPETFSACLILNQRASVWQTNLAEVDEAYLGEGMHEVTVEADPWKIITFRLIFCSENGKTPLVP
jgi:alpha-mannosidase